MSASGRLPQKYLPIHFAWIGGKSKIPGQDIGGPIEMAKVNNNNPIYFWCLEKDINHFEEQLKEYKNIRVRTVESHMNKSTLTLPAEKLKHMYDTLIKGDGRGSTRDRVTFFDALNLFNLQSKIDNYEGGFALNTNDLPLGNKKISLEAREKFFAVTLAPDEPMDATEVECWMMFSPSASCKEAEEIFSEFYRLWKIGENIRNELLEKKESLEDYYDYMSSIPVQAIYSVYKNNEDEMGFFKATPGVGNVFADIHEKDFDIRKTYSNTHKYHLRNKYDVDPIMKEEDTELNEIFALVSAGNIPQLRVMIIDGKGDINEKITKTTDKVYEGETPLHIAIRFKQPEEVIWTLLELKADLKAEANYTGSQGSTIKYSARDLMELKGYKQILKKYDDQHSVKMMTPAPLEKKVLPDLDDTDKITQTIKSTMKIIQNTLETTLTKLDEKSREAVLLRVLNKLIDIQLNNTNKFDVNDIHSLIREIDTTRNALLRKAPSLKFFYKNFRQAEEAMNTIDTLKDTLVSLSRSYDKDR